MKGQFVQFKVVKGDLEYLYPLEKYCFLPEEKKGEFWTYHDKNNGEFKEFPSYIILLSLAQIKNFIMQPVLV